MISNNFICRISDIRPAGYPKNDNRYPVGYQKGRVFSAFQNQRIQQQQVATELQVTALLIYKGYWSTYVRISSVICQISSWPDTKKAGYPVEYPASKNPIAVYSNQFCGSGSERARSRIRIRIKLIWIYLHHWQQQ